MFVTGVQGHPLVREMSEPAAQSRYGAGWPFDSKTLPWKRENMHVLSQIAQDWPKVTSDIIIPTCIAITAKCGSLLGVGWGTGPPANNGA